MSQEIRLRNQARNLYTRALSSVYRNAVELHDPSLWLLRDPEVEEKMLRDADIRHAVGYRRHLIAGKDWSLVPRDETAELGRRAVHVGTELLKEIEGFTAARMNLARAFFSGARFARIHGEPRILRLGDGKPRTWWVPTRLEDVDKRMFRIVPHNDEGDLSAHWERWDVGKVEFIPETRLDALHTIKHVYQDDEASLGHGTALREALGFVWYSKEHVLSESMAAVEKFAQGILTAKIDGARDAETGLPNEELIAEWVAMLEDLRARHVLVYDKSDDVEIMHGGGDGWQLLETIRTELRTTIYTLVMGANLTTAASEGGSYALAEIQENSTEALIQFDRETLQETLSRSLLRCIWTRNRPNLVELGISEECPFFHITQEKRQDPQERANVAAVLNGIGVDLSLGELLEQTGFSRPEPGEEVIDGGSGSGGGFDMGGLGGALLDIPDAPSVPEGADIQDTAMNGAQVTAAKEIILDVVNGAMPPTTAKLMLVSMFNMDPVKASAMVDDAAAFEPAGAPAGDTTLAGGA